MEKTYYNSFPDYCKQQYGRKLYRVALNAGMSCPNRDGTIGKGGCIFCDEGGSGDFAIRYDGQSLHQEDLIYNHQKCNAGDYIAYFQSFTNTYAPVEYLRKIFTEAIADPEVVILSVATRPDCLPEEVLDLLAELNEQKPVWIELGLQTMHEETAQMIHRGYDLACFEQAVKELRRRDIDVIVHTILGLPMEGTKEVLETVTYLNQMDIQGIKLQLLHILKGTELGRIYLEQEKETEVIRPMTMEEYIDLVIACVEHLSPEITIHRLTGDGPKDLLIAPLWSSRKRTVLNEIHSELKKRNVWQGKMLGRSAL